MVVLLRRVSESLPSLADRFNGRANSINFLRIMLALSVLVSHSWPLGLGHGDLGERETWGQSDVGTLSVYGFFLLSGFLITGSALRFSLPRYFWHRALRILPGFWVCLIVTAFVAAPAAALYEHGNLDGFISHPQGPLQYLKNNWFLSMSQYTISGLLNDVPYSHASGGAFDGSLWSLKYEVLCYGVVALLALTAALSRARRVVLLLTAGAYWIILEDFLRANGVRTQPAGHGGLGPYPLVGQFSQQLLIYLLFFFMLGAVAKLYADRIPMHAAIAAAAVIAFLVSLRFGGFYPVGTVAWAYLVMYLSVALPRWFQKVGRRRDYSYGIYIYAFPVQQLVSMTVGLRYSLAGYIAISAAGTIVLAALSWHLVERPAMSLKDWTPWFVRRGGRPAEVSTTETVPAERLVLPPQRAPESGAVPERV